MLHAELSDAGGKENVREKEREREDSKDGATFAFLDT